jgi:hypothetical protein
VITGLARLDGWPVAVDRQRPVRRSAGCGPPRVRPSSNASSTSRDLPPAGGAPRRQPGLHDRPQAEHEATIRAGARALAAIYQATVPWCSVIVRKVFGVAGRGQPEPHPLPLPLRLALGRLGLAADRGRHRGRLQGRARRRRPIARRRSPEITQRLNLLRSPFRSAENFQVEEIIDPRDTRRLLCEFAEIAAPLRRTGRRRSPTGPERASAAGAPGWQVRGPGRSRGHPRPGARFSP